jgi:hypothetical protein
MVVSTTWRQCRTFSLAEYVQVIVIGFWNGLAERVNLGGLEETARAGLEAELMKPK